MIAAFPFKKELILENNRVRLSPLSNIHYGHLSHIVTDNPTLLKYSPSPWGTVAYLKDYIDIAVSERQKALRYPLVIFDKDKNLFAGSTSFMSISDPNQRIEIGHTWIGEKFQRSGLNRNTKFLMMKYAFEDLGYVRVEFKTDARNTQSRTAIEAIGGKYEGLLRSHTLMSDGFRRDTVYYSVLADEWPGIKNTIFKNYS